MRTTLVTLYPLRGPLNEPGPALYVNPEHVVLVRPFEYLDGEQPPDTTVTLVTGLKLDVSGTPSAVALALQGSTCAQFSLPTDPRSAAA